MATGDKHAASQLLASQLALITGATGGIGAATARLLAQHGCSVAVHYHSASEKAETLVRELQSNGVRAAAFRADLGSWEEVRALHAAVVAQLGHPSILFNNAGTTMGMSGVRDIKEVSVDVFELTWRVNCGAAALLAQLCVPAMAEKSWGRVLFNSSVAAFTGGLVGPHYASSKSAQHGLIHWLSQAYCGKGITVNGVAPALIEETAMLPGKNAELAKKIPIGRLGQPSEIAETILWLIRTGYMTNQVVPVDGGLIAH